MNKLHLDSKQTKVILFLLLLVTIVRLFPYFIPIKATDLTQDRQAVEFQDRHGLALGTLLTRDRDHTAVVPLTDISPHFLQAILAAEDGRFYAHGALEIRAIARSFFQYLQYRQIKSGASTITMQLARMLANSPRTFKAKMQEIWLSWRIFAGMNRDEILAAYINRLPMGSNIYGVEAAARIYFGIPASQLNLAQASLLAAIPNDPNHLNPYQNWKNLKRRQVYVLKRMHQDGYISQEQRENAYQEKIALQSRQQGIIAAHHFLFWLASQLPPDHPAQIRTTINRPLQEFVQTQVQQIVAQLATYNVHHAATLVVDNHSGEVLAYVGSPDYFAAGILGSNDGVQALRQPGSTLKPFLYQLALSQGKIRPQTILADVPTDYAIPNGQIYSPTDYQETFNGPVLVRTALANSLNIPAVRILEQVGVANFLNYLHQLGFRHLNQPPEHYGLGLTLGAGEVTLWELAQAYLTMARQGDAIPLITTLGKSERSIKKLGEESIWALITDILSDRYARTKSFGIDSVLNLPFSTAVKTGTSSNFRDTWTIGFSSDYTVATWVGNFNGDPMQKISGVMGAAPLWQRIMLHLHEQQTPEPFMPPSTMVQLPICASSGLKPDSTCPAVVQEYLFSQDLQEYTLSPQNSPSLSAEYNQWLARQPQNHSLINKLRILVPAPGDKFLINARNREQQLKFQIAAIREQPVEWWLNGKKLTTNSQNSWFWSMRPGKWTLKVKSANQSDEVSFEVAITQISPTRRGFSLRSSPGNP